MAIDMVRLARNLTGLEPLEPLPERVERLEAEVEQLRSERDRLLNENARYSRMLNAIVGAINTAVDVIEEET